ncbi:MAG TPA: alanine racemase [Candidatus Acidoferrales bacterium]|nr:alanine racemase [Candidatus Acidoferrales bacterium]
MSEGRPTRCYVDAAALRANFRTIRQRTGAGVKILCVVKANAYGHGATAVARILEKEGSDAFGVATVEEGVELRRAGIGAPIVVLAGTYPGQLDEVVANRLTPVISSLEMLRAVEGAARARALALNFHLKVDTGMHRIGLLAAAVESWLAALGELRALKLEGVLSHFAQAESVHGEYTQNQLRLFRRLLARLAEAGYRPPVVHLANSAAVITLPEAYFSMVRPGIMLYGVYPSAHMAAEIALKPALSWKTEVLQVKKLPPGSRISYGGTFVTQRESVIATLPVGYADGYRRLLSNRARVLVHGRRAPVVGAVCMDLTMVDVTDIRDVKQGDEVVLVGEQGGEAISVDEMASWANTIPYEILTSIGARVPRYYENL